jgi:transcriptional regulator with XRE-family HTH domain
LQESLGKRLKRLRVQRKLSIKEVAERVGVPQTTYREWENDRKIVGEPYLDLARVFEVSIYELISGETTTDQVLVKSIESIEVEIKKMKEHLILK